MQPSDPNAQSNEPQATPEPQVNPMPGQPVNPTPQPVVSPMQPEAPTVVSSGPSADENNAAQVRESHTPSGAASTQATDYISNPFLNAARGLVAILKSNPVPVMLAGLWFIVGYIGFIILVAISRKVLPVPLTLLFSLIGFIVAWMVIYGAYIDIAARSAADEAITTKQAFSKGFKKTLPLLALTILSGLAITFGLILLIIPGVIILARISLAPLAMFEENLGVIASMKRSAELTKGHVNEMLGALFATMLMGSQGLLIGAISLAPLVGRYHDLKALKESGAPKPKVHWLNYSYLLLIVFIALYFLLVASSIAQLSKSKKETELKLNSTPSYQYQYNSDSSTNFDYSSDPSLNQ